MHVRRTNAQNILYYLNWTVWCLWENMGTEDKIGSFLYSFMFSQLPLQFHITSSDSLRLTTVFFLCFTVYCVALSPIEIMSYGVTQNILLLWTQNNMIPPALAALPEHHNFQPEMLSWGKRLSRRYNKQQGSMAAFQQMPSNSNGNKRSIQIIVWQKQQPQRSKWDPAKGKLHPWRK